MTRPRRPCGAAPERTAPGLFRSLLFLGFLCAGLASLPARADTPAQALPPQAPAVSPEADGVGLGAESVLAHLNAISRWYRDIQEGGAWVLQPADQFYWNSEQTSANEVVKQAFTAAQAEAGLIPSEQGKPRERKAPTSLQSPARIAQSLAEAQNQVDDLKAQIVAINHQLAGRLSPSDRDALQTQKQALTDAEEINGTLVDYLGRAQSLLSGSATESEQTVLMGQITAIRASVHGAFGTNSSKQAAPAQPSEVDPSGTFAQAALVVRILKDEHEIDRMIGDSGSITGLVKQIDAMLAPLRAAGREIVLKGQEASEEVSRAKGAELTGEQRKLAGLASTLRDITDASLALRAEEMALEQCRANLYDWKSVIARHRDAVLRSLLERLVVIAILIVVLVVTSELWRRATFRYVHDLRRRRQLLMVRRVAYGSLIALVLIMGLVSNLGSLATFAGFITAGIAVAAQTIIVSIAAFFFMMGRNGVHVGDRVTVTSSTGATITGKIVEIDLVRFSVMELTGTGLDLRPTGRIASYANSVLFQTVPFFKHITGADYGWHEIAVPLKPEADFDRVQKLVLDAVNEVYGEYRKILENQRGVIERQNEITLDIPEPTSQVMYGAKGPEVVTGYPIDRTGRISMDLRVAHGVRDALAKDKAVAEMVDGEPEMRGPVKAA